MSIEKPLFSYEELNIALYDPNFIIYKLMKLLSEVNT